MAIWKRRNAVVGRFACSVTFCWHTMFLIHQNTCLESTDRAVVTWLPLSVVPGEHGYTVLRRWRGGFLLEVLRFHWHPLWMLLIVRIKLFSHALVKYDDTEGWRCMVTVCCDVWWMRCEAVSNCMVMHRFTAPWCNQLDSSDAAVCPSRRGYECLCNDK